jgi:hypothetical protein
VPTRNSVRCPASYSYLGDDQTALTRQQQAFDSFANVGAVESHLGRHKLALEHAQRALDIFAKILGPEHSKTLNAMLVVVNGRLSYRTGVAYHLLESWLDKLPADHPRRAGLAARLRELPTPPGRRKASPTGKRSKKRP